MSLVVLPQIRLVLAAAWVIVFVLAFGELGTSILVAPPGETTLPIRIYTMIANAPPSHVAALALLQALAIFAPIALLGAATSLREVR
jgi:iron(III) transport system permease protein